MDVSNFALRTAAATISTAALLASACTFAGLGNYDVETCARPRGVSMTVQKVGAVSDVTFASASGKNVIGAFAANVTGGACIEAVRSGVAGSTMASGFLNLNCSFLGDETNLVPRQPMVVPLSGGYAAAIIATTAPCTAGALIYRFNAPGVAGKAALPCAMSGAALPAIAPLSDGSTAIVAWYATSLDSRSDPIGSCTGARAAPLNASVVTSANGSPTLGAAVDLGDTGISVRAPAVAPLPGQAQAIIAAPLGNDVGVWTIGVSTSPGQPITIPGLAGARAVALAIASDNSGRIAVVAEIGCAPQSIALAVGTLAGGFSNVAIVAAADGALAVGPSVAWIDGQNRWVVAWVSATGGAHVLTRSFDATGSAVGAVVDPAMSATGAAVTSGGDVIGFVASSSSFVDTSLGCGQ